ncbi:hypothetical protein, partial [Escherichia coli]|uniref:hypothetical protein n=1 Tax=Escherichia coli TaxID=562 RepID=UPI0032DBD219
RVLRGLTHEQLALVDVYKSKNLIGGKYFDPSVLREFGCKEMVNRLLRNPQWSKVFEWRGSTCTPVAYEFLAPLNIKKEPNNARKSISYVLFGKRYNHSVDEQDLILGLHTRDEMSMPYFRRYHVEFDSDRDAATHITNDAEYNSSNLKARKIQINHLKAIFRLNLEINLSGMKTNLNKAYWQDLFYIWSME